MENGLDMYYCSGDRTKSTALHQGTVSSPVIATASYAKQEAMERSPDSYRERGEVTLSTTSMLQVKLLTRAENNCIFNPTLYKNQKNSNVTQTLNAPFCQSCDLRSNSPRIFYSPSESACWWTNSLCPAGENKTTEPRY